MLNKTLFQSSLLPVLSTSVHLVFVTLQCIIASITENVKCQKQNTSAKQSQSAEEIVRLAVWPDIKLLLVLQNLARFVYNKER